MNYKKVIIAKMLFSTMIGGSAWAQTTHNVVNGTSSWSGDQSITGVPGWPGSGIRGDGGITGIINTDGNINTSNNHSGVFISNGTSVTFNNTDPMKTFTANSNTWEGFLVESNSSLMINDMNVSANGNADNGVRADTGGKVFITGTSIVEFNNNGAKGIFAYSNGSSVNITGDGNSSYLYVNDNNSTVGWGGGIWSENNALVNITDMNIEVNNNGLVGVMVRGGDVVITGNGHHLLQVTDNGIGGNDDGGIVVTQGGNLDVTGMDIQIDDNGRHGLQVSVAGVATIRGSGSVQNTLTANGNDFAGLASMNAGSVLNIIDMDIQANNNNGSSDGSYGILTQDGGKMTITGSVSNPNTFTVSASGNKNNAASWTEGTGLAAQGVSGTSASTIIIQNMDVEANDNGRHGLSATDGGVIHIIGDGSHMLEALRNVTSTANPWADGAGIYANGSNSANSAMKSTISIEGMNITVSDNDFHGVRATEGGVINMVGTNNNTLEVTANKNSDGSTGNGIVADSVASDGSSSIVKIQDMDVLVEDQSYQGIAALRGGLVHIASVSGANTLEIFNTRMTTNTGQDLGKGIHAKEASASGTVATVVIKDMDIISNDNELEGLVAADSGVIYIESSSGNNKLIANENRNYAAATPGNWTYGAGLLAHGISSSASGQQASIIIRNMNVEVNSNGMYGIYVRDGGLISITGNGSHTLDVIGNQTSNPLNNEGIGISVSDVSNGIRSQLDIVDMDILIDSNLDAGIKAGGGSLVNIISNAGTNTLKANNNDNHGTQYNEGAGIWAFGTDGAITPTASTINLIGLDIEAKNNGSYGVLSEGGYINIQGDGTHKLDLDGNGRYGLLAKDGGSADITGMVVSGNSSDHAFVGIEREGLIHFTNSSITTDTDTLFYTWSDNNTQTSQYILDNSVAIGNGTKLAYFSSHNGVLEATDSYLENAIVTDAGAGVTSTVSLVNSTWVMRGSSTITNLTANNSIIDMRGNSGYNTLTLSRLTSDNSIYLLNTYFDFPGLTTDKIVVDGDGATGTNNILKVSSTGYAASTNRINGYGIQVVNLDNATDKSVDFTLFGGVVDSGAYDYWLYRAADDNYYLQTNHQATTTAKTITNIPAIHLSIVKAGLNEFRHRITELREHDVFHPNEFWIRTYGKRLRVDDTIDSRMNLYGVEMGYDKEVHEDDDNKYYAGIMAGYIYTDNIRNYNPGYPDGTARANAPSVGLYGVWDNSDGWYSYATLRYFWSKMKAENYTSSGELISYRPNRDFITASIELGKQFEHITGNDTKLIIEPKGELRYAYAKGSSFRTNMGYDIHYGTSKSFTTRAALLLGYNHRSGSGSVYEPFVEVGISKEWLGDTDVKYADGIFDSSQKGTNYDIAVGLRAKINENWSLLGNLGYEKGSVHKGFGGQLGGRYSW